MTVCGEACQATHQCGIKALRAKLGIAETLRLLLGEDLQQSHMSLHRAKETSDTVVGPVVICQGA